MQLLELCQYRAALSSKDSIAQYKTKPKETVNFHTWYAVYIQQLDYSTTKESMERRAYEVVKVDKNVP